MIETAWKFLVELKLPFEERILIFAAIAAALLAANGFHLIVKRRETWIGVTNFLHRLQDSRFEFLPDWQWVRGLDRAWRSVLKAEFMFIRHGHLAPYNLLAVLTLAVLTAATIFSRPYILASNPGNGSFMLRADQPLELEFSLPVDIEKLSLNVSPEVAGRWEFERTSLGIPVRWKARFYPEESFFPGKKVVVYVVGLKSLWNPEVIHEQAVEFYSPKVPDIIAVSPADGSRQVPIDTKVEIEYDSVLGEFVEFDFQTSPASSLRVEQNGGTRQILGFEDNLSQSREYKVEVYRTLRSYKVGSGEEIEEIEVSETEKIEEIVFQTVEAPLVASYRPSGSAVKTGEVVRIVFEQPMDRESVESRFSIAPGVEGTVGWEDERTFLFTPGNGFPKETEYRIAFEPGMRNVYGGVTEKELAFEFETIGKVKVLGISPLNGTYKLDPEKTNVVVEFDQEVDRTSAEKKFSISPSVAGNFVWDGNKMIYTAAGKLSYSKTYTVSVAKGVKTVHGLDSAQEFQSSFTTRDYIVELAVPQYYQNPVTQTFNCNLVAAQMALAYRGVSVTQAQVKSALGVGQNPNASFVEQYGTHTGPIAAYLDSKGISYEIKTGWNLADLAKEIEKGRPVILWWYNRYSQPKGAFTLPGGYTGYKGMHSEVVRGFAGPADNPTKLYVNDPWRGPLVYDRALFLATWAYLNYTAIVIH